MEVGIIIGLVLFLAFVALGVVVTVRVVRAVKRGVERTGAQVRRTVEETTLKARGAQPGPVGEVARLRSELRASIDSTGEALEAGAADDPALQEALGLLDQLFEHARQLDRELRALMEREPDRGRIAARLPEARERVRAIKESADSLRFAAQDRARQFDAEGLDALRAQIDIESAALRHWMSGTDPLADPAPPRPSASASEPSASRPAGPGQGEPAAAPPPQPELGPSRPYFDDLPGTGPAGPAAEPAPESPRFGKRRPRSAS